MLKSKKPARKPVVAAAPAAKSQVTPEPKELAPKPILRAIKVTAEVFGGGQSLQEGAGQELLRPGPRGHHRGPQEGGLPQSWRCVGQLGARTWSWPSSRSRCGRMAWIGTDLKVS